MKRESNEYYRQLEVNLPNSLNIYNCLVRNPNFFYFLTIQMSELKKSLSKLKNKIRISDY